ncbi:MAG: rhomboid family intramembrane serine protease [Polyangiales bacterium]
MQRVGPIHSRKQLGEFSLVLSSMSIGHAIDAHDDGFYLSVAAGDAARTERALQSYQAENRDWPPAPAARERLPYPPSQVVPVVMSMVAAFFAVTGPAKLGSLWFQAGTATSDRILHGEVFRAVTALTLHADAMHLVGNVFAGWICLAAVFRRLGAGRGVFYTVIGGVLGNLLNAALHAFDRFPHRSIGASTAVFAAVGVLAATQLAFTHASGARRWLDWVMPIVGSFALLGMLGSSPQADLWAHLFGLLGGFAMGWVASRSRSTHEKSRRMQVHFGAASAALVLTSWMIALVIARRHGL